MVTFDGLGTGNGFTVEGYEDVVQFHGIPYAEAPIGEKRFKIPELKSSWNDEVTDLTKKQNICPQVMFSGRVSERLGNVMHVILDLIQSGDWTVRSSLT